MGARARWETALNKIGLDGAAVVEGQDLGPLNATLIDQLADSISSGDVKSPTGYARTVLRRATRQHATTEPQDEPPTYDPTDLDATAMEVWEKARQIVEARIPRPAAATLLPSTVGVSIGRGTFVLGVPRDRFTQMSNTVTIIEQAIQQVTSRRHKVHLCLAPE